MTQANASQMPRFTTYRSIALSSRWRIFALASLMALACEGVKPRDEPPPHPTATEQARALPEDYDGIVNAAWSRDSAMLDVMFVLEEHENFSGAAASEHRAVLRALLERWGDSAFARVLSGTDAMTRTSVVRAVSAPDSANFATRFPRTRTLADSGGKPARPH